VVRNFDLKFVRVGFTKPPTRALGNQIDDISLTTVISVFEKSHALENLCLWDNFIGDIGVNLLVTGLESVHNLQRLELWG